MLVVYQDVKVRLSTLVFIESPKARTKQCVQLSLHFVARYLTDNDVLPAKGVVTANLSRTYLKHMRELGQVERKGCF